MNVLDLEKNVFFQNYRFRSGLISEIQNYFELSFDLTYSLHTSLANFYKLFPQAAPG